MKQPRRHTTLANLPNNNRFYILLITGLLSLVVLGATRMNIVSDQLFYIRLEQIFGLLALLYWYFALLLTPLSKVLPKSEFMEQLLFARRALGVSAAYFALLHSGVALWGQLGGLGQLSLLPQRFQTAIILGALALSVLIVMAGTSFDKVIDFLSFRRWKWIHRFGYGAGILAIIHVWLIGTHITRTPVKYTAFAMLILLFSLEAIRLEKILHKKLKTEGLPLGLAIIFWFMLMIGLVALSNTTSNYHGGHQGGAEHGDQNEN